MANLQKITGIIGREMEKAERTCKMPWKNQLSKPWSAKRAAKNTMLLYSYAIKITREENLSRKDLLQGQYYDETFIDDMGILPMQTQKFYKYNPNNPNHQKRISKLLS